MRDLQTIPWHTAIVQDVNSPIADGPSMHDYPPSVLDVPQFWLTSAVLWRAFFVVVLGVVAFRKPTVGTAALFGALAAIMWFVATNRPHGFVSGESLYPPNQALVFSHRGNSDWNRDLSVPGVCTKRTIEISDRHADRQHYHGFCSPAYIVPSPKRLLEEPPEELNARTT